VSSLINAVLHWYDASTDWTWLAETAAWTWCAVISYVTGLIRRQTLFTFIGVAFALVPAIHFVRVPVSKEIGVIILTVSLTLVFCSMLRRYVNPKLRAPLKAALQHDKSTKKRG
jgi:hypothetical protein